MVLQVLSKVTISLIMPHYPTSVVLEVVSILKEK